MMQSKYTFKAEFEDKYNPGSPKSSVTYETTSVTLDSIICEFELFLRGAGFGFKGSLEVVDEEE